MRWLAQVPDVNSALVSINPQNGAVLALVGGFDFNQSKFNRATQALRQVGSNIKPFLYTAAMDKGLTLASILNDVPISLGCRCRFRLAAEELAGGIRRSYSPSSGAGSVEKRGDGACNACDGRRLRGRVSATFWLPGTEHRAHRIAGVRLGIVHAAASGAGYSVMANGGFLIDPYFISKIENDRGGVLFEAKPKIACAECDIPVIYGNTPKSDVLENKDMEDVAVSQEQPNGVMPQPQLEQANRALVAQSGAQEYAPHVINTRCHS